MSAMHWLGRLLRPLRPGVDALTGARVSRKLPRTLTVTSPEFKEGDTIPLAFTADGEGLLPGLSWSGVPAGAQSLVLLVEDADIPMFKPVTHLIVHSIPPGRDGLAAGAVGKSVREALPFGGSVGRNFLGARGWTPPAPPPGHGGHRYAFQVFALDSMPVFRFPPRRATLMRRIRSHIVAHGALIGTYKRV